MTRALVTGADFGGVPAGFRDGGTFATRNAPEYEAWHAARRQAFRDGRQRHWRARRGESCGSCGRDLDQHATVWRAQVCVGAHGDNPVYWMTILCRACRPSSREWHHPHTCDTCGRAVVVEVRGSRSRRHVFCCERCASRWHNEQRNQRARQARERTCPICGRAFVGSRRDASTCSPACRQKAFRLRRKGIPVQPERGESSLDANAHQDPPLVGARPETRNRPPRRTTLNESTAPRS
jgi:hypothetical protein